MTDLRNVVYLVGAALILSITGIIIIVALGHTPVPDVLQNIAVGSLTGLVGLLVPTEKRRRRDEAGAVDYGWVPIAIGVIVGGVVLWLLGLAVGRL